MHGERGVGLDVDAGAGDFGGSFAARRAIGAGEGFGAEIGGAFRKDDVRAGGLDGDGPLVAGDIPVELVMIVEKLQSVGDDVLMEMVRVVLSASGI